MILKKKIQLGKIIFVAIVKIPISTLNHILWHAMDKHEINK
jgi:hypothetical protein